MPDIKNYKPGVGQRVHIFLTAALWTGIGVVLVLKGTFLLWRNSELWLLAVGLAAGTVKSFMILDRAVYRGIDRIHHFSDKTCIGAVYSWKSWLMVFSMMAVGIILRRLEISPLFIGTVLAAIGWSLIFSSRYAWKDWLNTKAHNDT